MNPHPCHHCNQDCTVGATYLLQENYMFGLSWWTTWCWLGCLYSLLRYSLPSWHLSAQN